MLLGCVLIGSGHVLPIKEHYFLVQLFNIAIVVSQ